MFPFVRLLWFVRFVNSFPFSIRTSVPVSPSPTSPSSPQASPRSSAWPAYSHRSYLQRTAHIPATNRRIHGICAPAEESRVAWRLAGENAGNGASHSRPGPGQLLRTEWSTSSYCSHRKKKCRFAWLRPFTKTTMPRALSTIILCDTWLHMMTRSAGVLSRTREASHSQFRSFLKWYSREAYQKIIGTQAQ